MSTASSQQRQFPCRNCGANLVFAPGQVALVCPYCRTENIVEALGEAVEELDFQVTLATAAQGEETVEALTVHCEACGAEQTLAANVTADRCAFCGAAIVTGPETHASLKPRSLLPFHVPAAQAMELFLDWVASRWFAPNDLKRHAEAGGLKGVYIPYWTYDCATRTKYTGERGEDYWTTETYTAHENGRAVTKTRQVRKTRWYPASGMVSNTFDDVLVLASHSLPRKYTESLEPWDLGNLVPYREEYLAGFVAERYQMGLEEGFEDAKGKMEEPIRQSIRRDIGGDHQRIHSMNTRYEQITFKHLLLPLWISAYRYRDKVFRFLVNARTGEVCGERPYSMWKIAVLTLFCAIVFAVILFFANQ